MAPRKHHASPPVHHKGDGLSSTHRARNLAAHAAWEDLAASAAELAFEQDQQPEEALDAGKDELVALHFVQLGSGVLQGVRVATS